MNKLSILTNTLASVFLATMLATSQAYGDRLFATSGSGSGMGGGGSASTLYELDLNHEPDSDTPMARPIGPIRSLSDSGDIVKLYSAVNSIAFHPETGLLYGISNKGMVLITIDPDSAVVTHAVNITGSMVAKSNIRSPDMGFTRDGLYTWSELNPGTLNVIPDLTTGESFEVGINSIGDIWGVGLDVDSNGTVYFKNGSGDIYIIYTVDNDAMDIKAGAESFVVNIDGEDMYEDQFDNALAFDSNDNLFTIDRTFYQEFDDGFLTFSMAIEVDLYSIDLLAGETKFIGSTGLPTLAAIAFQKSGSEFETFSITKAEIQFEDDPDKEKFKSEGVFTLDSAGAGIDPLNEEVTFGAGTVLVTIPAGSFVLGAGMYEFKGIIDGADVKVKIEQKSQTEFKFKAEAKRVVLTDTANPTEFVLTIGSKTGNALVRLEGKLKFPGKKDKKDKKGK
jgi:hypothetical protein